MSQTHELEVESLQVESLEVETIKMTYQVILSGFWKDRKKRLWKSGKNLYKIDKNNNATLTTSEILLTKPEDEGEGEVSGESEIGEGEIDEISELGEGEIDEMSEFGEGDCEDNEMSNVSNVNECFGEDKCMADYEYNEEINALFERSNKRHKVI